MRAIPKIHDGESIERATVTSAVLAPGHRDLTPDKIAIQHEKSFFAGLAHAYRPKRLRLRVIGEGVGPAERMSRSVLVFARFHAKAGDVFGLDVAPLSGLHRRPNTREPLVRSILLWLCRQGVGVISRGC